MAKRLCEGCGRDLDDDEYEDDGDCPECLIEVEADRQLRSDYYASR